MNIRLEYTLTPDDFYEFQRAYLKNRKSLTRGIRKPILSRPFVLITFFFVIMIWMQIVSRYFAPPVPAPAPATEPAQSPAVLLLLYFAPALAVFVVILSPWWRKTRYRQAFDELQKMREPTINELTDTHMTIRQPGCVGSMEWSYFIRFIETGSVLLFFTSARVAHIIPKRAFADEADLREFRSFAQAHVGNQPVGFPVQRVVPPPMQR